MFVFQTTTQLGSQSEIERYNKLLSDRRYGPAQKLGWAKEYANYLYDLGKKNPGDMGTAGMVNTGINSIIKAAESIKDSDIKKGFYACALRAGDASPNSGMMAINKLEEKGAYDSALMQYQKIWGMQQADKRIETAKAYAIAASMSPDRMKVDYIFSTMSMIEAAGDLNEERKTAFYACALLAGESGGDSLKNYVVEKIRQNEGGSDTYYAKASAYLDQYSLRRAWIGSGDVKKEEKKEEPKANNAAVETPAVVQQPLEGTIKSNADVIAAPDYRGGISIIDPTQLESENKSEMSILSPQSEFYSVIDGSPLLASEYSKPGFDNNKFVEDARVRCGSFANYCILAGAILNKPKFKITPAEDTMFKNSVIDMLTNYFADGNYFSNDAFFKKLAGDPAGTSAGALAKKALENARDAGNAQDRAKYMAEFWERRGDTNPFIGIFKAGTPQALVGKTKIIKIGEAEGRIGWIDAMKLTEIALNSQKPFLFVPIYGDMKVSWFKETSEKQEITVDEQGKGTLGDPQRSESIFREYRIGSGAVMVIPSLGTFGSNWIRGGVTLGDRKGDNIYQGFDIGLYKRDPGTRLSVDPAFIPFLAKMFGKGDGNETKLDYSIVYRNRNTNSDIFQTQIGAELPTVNVTFLAVDIKLTGDAKWVGQYQKDALPRNLTVFIPKAMLLYDTEKGTGLTLELPVGFDFGKKQGFFQPGASYKFKLWEKDFTAFFGAQILWDTRTKLDELDRTDQRTITGGIHIDF